MRTPQPAVLVSRAPWVLLSIVPLAALAIACSSQDRPQAEDVAPAAAAAVEPAVGETEVYALTQAVDMSIELTSTKFNRIRRIPVEYTCPGNSKLREYGYTGAIIKIGQDVSPPLAWSGLPEAARSLAIILESDEDPNADRVHWVIWNIPTEVAGLEESVATTTELLAIGPAARQGMNFKQQIGYTGPCPQPIHQWGDGRKRKTEVKSINTYIFNVYALDAELDLAAGSSRDDLLEAMDGHILAGGQLSTSHVGPIIKHGFE